ncbi:MAG: hypothetical protein A2W36_03970 [Chloroflexi bacterium RBG_16_58_14]|nr:MAG: hypothetical protein A2W36_03970 [Chloroflexi bacterium RBG_16_58_14]
MIKETVTRQATGVKPAILFIGSQMATGGAQRVLLDQAAWFYEHGYHVTAAFLYDQEGVHQVWQEIYPFPLVNLNICPPGGRTNPLRTFSGLPRIYRFLRNHRFDIIETFSHYANLLVLPLAWMASVPVRVGSHHGREANFPNLLNRLHSFIISSSITTCMVAVSQQVSSYAALEENIREDKIIVIPNGIQAADNRLLAPSQPVALRAELGLQPGAHLVCSVGYLTEQKGHRFLLEAIPLVIQKYPGTIFAIAGDGPLLKELKGQAEALNLAGAVIFLGNHSNVADLLSLADIFVLPSLWEGLPIALLEAMGAGVAVVASQVDGVEELIVDNQTGLLVPPSDSQALSQAILRLLEEPEFRVNLGQQGKWLVEKEFNQDQMCNLYRNLFENLLEGRQ